MSSKDSGRRKRKHRHSSSDEGSDSSEDDRHKHKKHKHHEKSSKRKHRHKHEHNDDENSSSDSKSNKHSSPSVSKEPVTQSTHIAKLRAENSRFELFPNDDFSSSGSSSSKFSNPLNDPTLGEEFVWSKNKRERHRQQDPEKRKREREEELERAKIKRAKREAERRERLDNQRNSGRGGLDPLLNDPGNLDQEKLFEYKQQFIRSQIRVSENRPNLIDVWYESINFYYDYLDLHSSSNNSNELEASQMEKDRREKYEQEILVLKSIGLLPQRFEYSIARKTNPELSLFLDQIQMFLFFSRQLLLNLNTPLHPLNTPIISSSSMKKRVNSNPLNEKENEKKLDLIRRKIEVLKAMKQLTKSQMEENNRITEEEMEYKEEQRAEQMKVLSGKSVEELKRLKNEIKSQHIVNNTIDVEYWWSLLSLLKSSLSRLILSTFRSSLWSVFPDLHSHSNNNNNNNTNETDVDIGINDNNNNNNVNKEKKDEEKREDEVEIKTVVEGVKGYGWQGKYRARKPVWTGRVKVGWEWNKYNKLHFQYDNPPPKVVQGYSFSVVYSDLIDKKQTPRWRIEREGEEEGMCVLRFMAGAPYEDIGFRIVDREWEKSHKKGFRCVFEKGVLHLWFNFKRWRYRR